MSTYEAFFGICEKPFDLTPNPRYLFLSECHEEALSALIYGVMEKKGIITLIGPVGVGKTTILYSFFDRLETRADIALFPAGIHEHMPTFLKNLCSQLKIAADKSPDYGLLEDLKRYGMEQLGRDRRVVVLVDEAQDLSVEALNMFRYLNNLETPAAKLIQVVLVGTEELDALLLHERLRSLRQRVAIRAVVNPLDPESSLEYIFHRVAVAGNSADALFTPGALAHVVNYSHGIPRLINVVCDNAMMLAFAAKKLPIDDSCLLETLRELDKDFEQRTSHEAISKEVVESLCRVFARKAKEKRAAAEPRPLVGQPPPPPAPPHPVSAEERHRPEAEERRPPAPPLPSMPRPPDAETYPVPPAPTPAPSFRPSRVWIALGLAGGILLAFLIAFFWGHTQRKEEPVSQPPQQSSAPALPQQDTLAREAPSVQAHPPVSPTPGPQAVEEGPSVAPSEESRAGGPSAPSEAATSPSDSQAQALAGTPGQAGPPAESGPVTVQSPYLVSEKPPQTFAFDSKGLAAIALERYDTLTAALLKLLKEANPHVTDWNKLGAHIELALPPNPSPEPEAPVDFYSVQLVSAVSEASALKAVTIARKKGVENVFVIRHGPSPKTGMAWIRVCAGVFETPDQSSPLLGMARQWGLKDAFTTRVQGKRLKDILVP